jgi:hypothetical protein
MTMRPESTEYAPYYEQYIRLVPDGDIISILDSQLESTLSLLGSLPETKAASAYAPGKWTIKEALGHIIDTERIFTYRALCIGRNDKTPLPGFEQEDYVANTHFNARPFLTLLDELTAVRRAGIALFRHFTEEEWGRRGTANRLEITTRALVYNIAGHERHHLNILKTRYL